MIFVTPLSPEEALTLENMRDFHPSHAARTRAHGVLLSGAGFTLKQLSVIFDVCRQTASNWLWQWETGGVAALLDKPRSGPPPKLTGEARHYALGQVTQSPRPLKTVLAKLAEKWGVPVSIASLKRLRKKAGLVWKRVRKSLEPKRDPELSAQAQQRLAGLAERARRQEIGLAYFDESGFTLEPCVPYAWQPVGETVEVPCAKSNRLNVPGIMDKNGQFHSWVFEQGITSAVAAAFVGSFAQNLTRPTVRVMDNAPAHTSDEFTDNIGRWSEQGLAILNLPPYSPELNLIEILWRKIKYEWLPFSAHQSFLSLKHSLFEVLANIGKNHHISFA